MYYQYGNTGYGVTSRGYTIFARFLPKNQQNQKEYTTSSNPDSKILGLNVSKLFVCSSKF